MRKHAAVLALAAILPFLLPAGVQAQAWRSSGGNADGLSYGTAFPSTPATGDVYVITDDSAEGACDSAAGSAQTLCRWNGAAWTALGDGEAAGGTVVTTDIDTSSELRAIVTDETGTGALVFAGGALGTPASVTLTNGTGLPISTGVTGLGTGVATALGTNVGSAGAPVVNGGALGTPSGGTLTNATGLPISTGVSGLGANVADFLATPSSANLSSAVTGETGTGGLVFDTSPVIATPSITGKVDRNNTAVNDDDCTGEQGVWWYDTTDSAFEFCNANSGAPAVLGGGGSGDVTAASAFGTDNVLIKADGTSKGVQATGISVADTNDITGVNDLTVGGDITVTGTVTASNLASFTDPNADAMVFWDDAPTGTMAAATLGSNLSLSSGTLSLGSGVTLDTEWDTAAEINSATTDDDFATLTGSQTLTNKTLTSPTIGTKINLPRVTALPGTPSAGDTVIVTDDSAAGACDSNAGSAESLCQYNGSAWAALGDGTGGGGGGDVTKVGTPANNQVGVWTGDGTIEGDAALTFDTATDTLAVAASGKIAFGAVNVLSDSAGTATLSNIDALDATTEATVEAAIDTAANLTSIQGHTVTLTGALVRSGAHSLTLTTSGATNVTLPTSGTLATVGGGLGAATATTPSANDNDTSVATTAYVQTELTARASDTVTYTNKTIDAEATGNVITIPFHEDFPAAGCNNTTATSFWDLPTTNPAVAACRTGTNVQKGTLDFANGANALTAQSFFRLPTGWTGNIDAIVTWSSSTTTGNVVWQLAIACAGDADADDPAFTDDAFTADATKGTANQLNDTASNTITTTGTCAAGDIAHLRIKRDPANGSDTMAGTARLLNVHLTYRAAL